MYMAPTSLRRGLFLFLQEVAVGENQELEA